MGWKALKHWGEDAVRIERLTGGAANDVWSVRVDGERAVGRLGYREDADLAWEATLLHFLDQHGFTVPIPIPTQDGRLFADGLTVMTFVEGKPPETKADWSRVAHTLQRLHHLTQDWPQRPGWRSSSDLLQERVGTRVNLNKMPVEAVARCRAAWARLVGQKRSVVHGNPANPDNIRLTADSVGLIDWDEAHVDVSVLDLVLPFNGGDLAGESYDHAAQASAAWEATVCWEDDHAVEQLAKVRAL